MTDPEHPTLSVPPFDGNPAKYDSFIQNFKSSIDDNHRIKTIAKFNILRDNLVGKPKQQIDALAPIEDNYQVALKLLEDTYKNNEYRHLDLLNKIKAFPRVSNNGYDNLQKFNNAVAEFYSYLCKSYSGRLTNSKEFYDIIRVRAPYKLAETLNQAAKERRRLYPNMHPMALDSDDLKHAVQALHDYTMDKIEQQQQEFLHGTTKVVKHPPSNMFAAYQSPVKPDPDCIFCNQPGHPSYRCGKNVTKTYARTLVESSGLCFRCLRVWDPYHTCNVICSKCGRAHNYRLCPVNKVTYRTTQQQPFRHRYDSRQRSPYRSPQPQRQWTPTPHRNRYGSQQRQFSRQLTYSRDRQGRSLSAYSRSPQENRPPPILRNNFDGNKGIQSRHQQRNQRPRSNSRSRNDSTVSFAPTPKGKSRNQTSTPNKSRPKAKSFDAQSK